MTRVRFADYNSYANATLKDIFTEEELAGAGHLSANYLQTAYFQGNAGGKFREITLPVEAQFSPVFSICDFDYDGDGATDLILGGNISKSRLRFGKNDANYGMLLKGDTRGNFKYVTQQKSGLKLTGDVRSILPINNTLLFGMNQMPVKAYRIRQ